MMIFVMLTRLSPDALRSPGALEELEQQSMAHIRKECPRVEWIQNLAVMGPYDYLDVFGAPDLDTAMKVATIIRTFGHATTELWPATQWKNYKELVRNLAVEPAGAGR
ncbi:GYD domain-containing protein [Geobacter sp. DSM 9736]|uniref:GYD domain-containing protein n=1 Tax=Geobacter sp. DSM 9736 TaxID=1277350 RepID=UPI000B50A8F5|nr:GYD domain-containing protein [Geobacter sp. DSM 9736]SNB46546.1 Uncharacterized protein, contains GYD domain [Geobacter sp. DSM 9736]